jgi:hypothetical protein
LLRAAYLGTLLAAAATNRDRVVLTLVGGGVFGNPIPLILEAIEWALAEVEPLVARDLDGVLNGYHLCDAVNLRTQVLPLVRPRGGAIFRFDSGGLADVLR